MGSRYSRKQDSAERSSTLDEVMADPANRDGVAVLISVKTDAKKSVRVNVTFPEDILEEIDTYAANYGLTRSGF